MTWKWQRGIIPTDCARRNLAKPVRAIQADKHGYQTEKMAYLPAQDRLVTLALNGIAVWDASTGHKLVSIPGDFEEAVAPHAASVRQEISLLSAAAEAVLGMEGPR